MRVRAALVVSISLFVIGSITSLASAQITTVPTGGGVGRRIVSNPGTGPSAQAALTWWRWVGIGVGQVPLRALHADTRGSQRRGARP